MTSDLSFDPMWLLPLAWNLLAAGMLTLVIIKKRTAHRVDAIAYGVAGGVGAILTFVAFDLARTAPLLSGGAILATILIGTAVASKIEDFNNMSVLESLTSAFIALCLPSTFYALTQFAKVA